MIIIFQAFSRQGPEYSSTDHCMHYPYPLSVLKFTHRKLLSKVITIYRYIHLAFH